MNTFIIGMLVSQGLFAKTYGGTDLDAARSIIQTTDGGFAVAGTTSSFGVGKADIFVLKLSSTGDTQWARTFGVNSSVFGYSIIQTADGGFAVAETTLQYGAGSSDFLVLKLGSDGNYPGCVDDRSLTVADISQTTSVVSGLPTWSPIVETPALTVTTPSPTITNVCTPVPVYEYVGDDGPDSHPGITYSPLPGGVLFVSPGDIAIKIYSADGRLAYSGNLEKGEK